MIKETDMNITVETPHLIGQELMIESFKESIEKRYGDRHYIHSVKATVELLESEEYRIGLLFEMIRGSQVYSRSIEPTLKAAISTAFQKSDAQILKFKTKNIVYSKGK